MKTLVDCGCEARVHSDGSGVEIDYCPLHESAPDLLKNLIDTVRRFEGCLITNGTDKEFAKSATVHARAAIEKAQS